MMNHRPPAIRFLLVILVLLVTTPARALPLTGFLEATADNGWQGAFAVQLPDGTVVTGTDQLMFKYGNSGANFASLPLVTTGCTVSSSCITVNGVTMTVLSLNLDGSSTLGSLGSLEWGSQGPELLPGNPSPTVAVLGGVRGTLGGATIYAEPFSFDFNATLTTTFMSTGDLQALASVRIDFSDGGPPPFNQTYWDGYTHLDVGIPVALGTPLAVAPVPEPSTLLMLASGLAGLGGMVWRRHRRG